ncbi:MBL fold metallo-hydrolase [Paenibacillus thalictri]|uniref:MBL fold metallo-hydrolase n=1 Tax=Paenibacillus thalictri TaxID=2527873 RepID=A0A4Q9DR20_9BACL|nr:MBL fold metallo-hydrolase [Paenibacillus thalictri]TBL76601.1 MBL fold metallo-hydrolase [Paenibacillus thalictri]
MNLIHALDIEFQFNEQLQTITPVLLMDEEYTILIDCGYPNFMDHIREAASRSNVALDTITTIILTHDDMDHIGSLAALKRSYPHIEVISHEIEAPYIDGTKKSLRLVQAEASLTMLPLHELAQAEQFVRFLQTIEHVPVDRLVSDKELLPWCGGIEIIHTPGHTPGHISLYLPLCKTLIAGDAVVIENGKLDIANPQFTLDLEAAVQSVRHLLAYDIEKLYCYHGGLFEGQVRPALERLADSYESRNNEPRHNKE